MNEEVKLQVYRVFEFRFLCFWSSPLSSQLVKVSVLLNNRFMCYVTYVICYIGDQVIKICISGYFIYIAPES